mmetsp:Transcript_8755/g.14849  ORF Transcript_8755/g.14849 Transcript_8755/m.14849 type:complete len:382 (+) Transcript_8755:1259-2404(+)
MLEKVAQEKLRCSELLKMAPENVQRLVKKVLDDQRVYVDLESLNYFLEERGFEQQEFKLEQFYDVSKLVADLREGEILSDFMHKFKSMKLDVVSLSEMRELLTQAEPTDLERAHTISQINAIINHVEEQLQLVSNQMREQITLEEFVKHMHFSNGTASDHLTSDLLRSKIDSVLGEAAQEAEVKSPSFNGILSHPAYILDPEQGSVDPVLAELHSVDDLRKQETLAVEDSELGTVSHLSKSALTEKAVYRDAMLNTEPSLQVKRILNKVENDLIALYLQPQTDQGEIERRIHDYTYVRMQECMTNPAYAAGLNSPNGHIYQKALKERLLDELKFTDSINVDDLDWGRVDRAQKELYLQVDPRDKYSLQGVNNEHAIGYNKV